MIYRIVVIRDRAANVFGQPAFVTSLGGAIRSFGDEVNRRDGKNMMAMHPDDFDLYEVGTYDDSDGSFSTFTPRQIAVGKDLVK